MPNQIDAYVVEIIGEPYQQYDHWWVDVKVDSHGVTDGHTCMCKTEEEAKAVAVGKKLLIWS